MEQRTLKNVNNCLYTNVYSYLETSGGISYNYSKKSVWQGFQMIYFSSSYFKLFTSLIDKY